MVLTNFELIYLGAWAFIGSVLGFFAFSYTPAKSPLRNLLRGILSIGIGLFIAFPLWAYLEETRGMSRTLSIMLSGLGAFGLPDFIVKWWPKFIRALAGKFLGKDSDCDDRAFSRFSSKVKKK